MPTPDPKSLSGRTARIPVSSGTGLVQGTAAWPSPGAATIKDILIKGVYLPPKECQSWPLNWWDHPIHIPGWTGP